MPAKSQEIRVDLAGYGRYSRPVMAVANGIERKKKGKGKVTLAWTPDGRERKRKERERDGLMGGPRASEREKRGARGWAELGPEEWAVCARKRVGSREIQPEGVFSDF